MSNVLDPHDPTYLADSSRVWYSGRWRTHAAIDRWRSSSLAKYNHSAKGYLRDIRHKVKAFETDTGVKI